MRNSLFLFSFGDETGHIVAQVGMKEIQSQLCHLSTSCMALGSLLNLPGPHLLTP